MNIKKWLWIILAIPFVLIILIEILLMWQSNGLKEKVQDIYTTQLDGELTLSSAKLSLLSSFPDVGLWMKDPTIIVEKDTLLHVKDAGLELSVWSLLFGNINFKSIHFNDGNIGLSRSAKNGKWNFDILKEQEKDTTTQDWNLVVDRIVLKNIAIELLDEVSKINVDLLAKNTTAKGSFEKDNISFGLNSELLVNKYTRKDIPVLQNINLNFELDVIVLDQTTQLENVVLFLGESKLEGNGTFVQTDKGNEWTLKLDGNRINLIQALELAGIYQKEITQGKFDVEIEASGVNPAKGDPTIIIAYDIKNGSAGGGFFSSGITEINSSGKYESSQKNNLLEVNTFEALNGKSPINASLSVSNFTKPTIKAMLSGNIPASWLVVLAPNTMSNIKGDLVFDKLELHVPSNKRNIRGKGGLKTDGFSFDINNNNFYLDQVSIDLANDKLDFQLVDGKFLNGDFNIKGEVENWANLVSNAGIVNIKLDADLKRIEALKWINQWETLASGEKEKSNSNFNIELNSTIAIDESNYGDVLVDEAQLQLFYVKDKLSWKGQAEAMKGTWKLDHSLHFWPSGGYSLRGDTECNNVEIVKLFSEFHDFGQDFISHKHLSGKLYAISMMDITWTKDAELVEDKMNLLVGARISKGELKGFPMLENFSTFVKIDDLKHIKFSEIINVIDISGGKIFIPAMFIQSNALNMDISGEHSFNHDMLYHFKINAGQVLTRKFESHDNRLLPVKAEKSGWFNIYYQISGTPDNFTYASNKRAVKGHFDAMHNRFDSGVIRLENKFGEIDWLRYPSDWSDVQLFDSKEKGKSIEFLDNF